MAGSVELATQGITSPFRVELKDPPAQKPVEPKAEPKAVKPEAAEDAAQTDLEQQAVQGVSDALNSVAKAVDRNLSFSVDKETGRIVIKVTDASTGDVIRVIPPEDISKMRESFGSLVGLLFNDQS